MSHKPRRTFTADQKAAILRRHHVDKVAITQLCEENELQPSLFSYWQQQLFENAASALQPPAAAAPSKALEAKVEALEKHVAKKDAVIDFTAEWSERTEIPATDFISWLGLQRGKFYAWKKRYGKVHVHNGRIPRDHRLTPDEKQAILDFHEKHPLDGYRVLRAAGRLDRWNRRPSEKGTGAAVGSWSTGSSARP